MSAQETGLRALKMHSTICTKRILGFCTLPAVNVAECPICYERIAIGTECTTLPCGHVFCVPCVEGWTKLQIERSTIDDVREVACPVCRRPFLYPAGRYQRHVLVKMLARDTSIFAVVGFYANINDATMASCALVDQRHPGVKYELLRVPGGDTLNLSDNLQYTIISRTDDGQLTCHGGFESLTDAREYVSVHVLPQCDDEAAIVEFGQWVQFPCCE